VGVPCPTCGREYDVALFAFGRTLHCACGARVGASPRVRTWTGEGPPRFAADAMLGRLARWLRLLGFDVIYAPDVADADLVRRAVAEQRAILTRDRRLPEEWRVEGVHLVRAEHTRPQLLEVVRRFDLALWMRPFTRCPRCNAPLAPATPEEVRARVPARVLAEHGSFRRCTVCGQVYWRGSHVRRIRSVIESLAAAPPPPAPPRR
jgi:uncharacterized protein with PIN domain